MLASFFSGFYLVLWTVVVVYLDQFAILLHDRFDFLVGSRNSGCRQLRSQRSLWVWEDCFPGLSTLEILT